MTRETAASSVGPGHDRPERARACLWRQAAPLLPRAAHDRPRPGETSRRVIDRADRPDAPRPVAGLPVRRDLRTRGNRPAPWLPPCQAPDGADVTGLARMTRRTRTG